GIALAADYRRTTRPTALLGASGALVVVFGWLHLWGSPPDDTYFTTAARFGALLGRHVAPGAVTRADGGLAGALITSLLSPLGVAGSYVVLVALGIASLLLLTETSLAAAAGQARERSQSAAALAAEPWRALRERCQNRPQPLFLSVAPPAAVRPGAGE